MKYPCLIIYKWDHTTSYYYINDEEERNNIAYEILLNKSEDYSRNYLSECITLDSFCMKYYGHTFDELAEYNKKIMSVEHDNRSMVVDLESIRKVVSSNIQFNKAIERVEEILNNTLKSDAWDVIKDSSELQIEYFTNH